jgi:hypothetical protein
MLGPSSPDDGASAPRPEHALLSLGALSHPEWAPFLERIGIETQPVEAAVEHLSRLPLGELERLRVLHDLGKAGRLREMAEPARNLAGGVVDLHRFDDLVELASDPGLSFKEFVNSINQQGIGSTQLLIADPEACTDDPTGPGPNQPTRIVASFEAPGHPHDFAYGADPLHWPSCNPFFLDMIPGPKEALPAVDNVDGTAYKTRLTEVVGIRFLLELSTNLDVRYFVAQDAVGMDYAFAGGDGRIDVDHGDVIVEIHPSRPNWVLVRSQKTVRFVGISNFPASLACELGWIYVMQNMASCVPSN